MPYFIKSKQAQGRYRAGQFHSAQGHVWPDDAFTKTQLASIKKDAVLSWKKLSDAEAEEKRKELGQAETPADTGDSDTAAQGAETEKGAA